MPTRFVMAGLDPAIHLSEKLDGRLKGGHDEERNGFILSKQW